MLQKLLTNVRGLFACFFQTDDPFWILYNRWYCLCYGCKLLLVHFNDLMPHWLTYRGVSCGYRLWITTSKATESWVQLLCQWNGLGGWLCSWRWSQRYLSGSPDIPRPSGPSGPSGPSRALGGSKAFGCLHSLHVEIHQGPLLFQVAGASFAPGMARQIVNVPLWVTNILELGAGNWEMEPQSVDKLWV